MNWKRRGEKSEESIRRIQKNLRILKGLVLIGLGLYLFLKLILK